MMEYVPGMPPLRSYDTSFVIVVGRAATYTVPFVGWMPIPFLKLVIPQDAEFFDGPGNKLRNGTTVQVTLSIDREYAALSFGPHGSLFMGKQPAVLYLNYYFLDLDGEAPTAASVLYQPASGGAWTPQPTVVDLLHWWLVTPIYHFSNYAVAYRH